MLWLLIKRKVGLVLLVIAFAGYKNASSTIGLNFFVNKPIADSSHIRVMTWNVNEFVDDLVIADTPGNQRRKMLAYIKEAQPDILCIQDATLNQVSGGYLSNLHDVLNTGEYKGYHFAYYIRHWYSPRFAQKYGVMILSRLAVIDTGSINMSISGSNEKVAYLDVAKNNKRIRIITAHLTSMNLWPSSQKQAGINYIKDSTGYRIRNLFSKIRDYGQKHATEARLIRSLIDTTKTPVIFCGDLNSVPSSYVYQHIKGELKDVFLEKGFFLEGTYNRVFPKLRIDVIFHSPQLQVVNYYRPVLNYSDHCPIIADLKWKE
jgi:endonuclease/exonuclease/phosphatase family metal-dependent hydrolase